MSSEAHVNNFSILQKIYSPFLRYLSFCIFNHPVIYQICNVMMNISTFFNISFEPQFIKQANLAN